MRAHGLRSLSASASSKKLLRKLDVAVEKEIPSLRCRIDPEQETASQPNTEEALESTDEQQLSTDQKND
jgi:hypothetical protein